MSQNIQPRVAVVQDGARLHYAVPVALQRAGALERVFVEWYAKPYSFEALVARAACHLRPALGTRMRQRVHPELDASRVITNARLAYKQARARNTFPTAEDFYAWGSEQVAQWVMRQGFGRANALFGFVRNISPELCARARGAGLTVVADQIIAPMVEERRQAAIQAERFPEWQQAVPRANETLVEAVEQRTWAAAHHLTCASDYVRDALTAAGVPADRVSVLPYPIDSTHFSFVDRSARTGPITVGMVGTLGLRKGTPYFLQVAGRLPSVRFSLVGPIATNPRLLAAHPNVTVVGPVPRGQIAAELAKFDVLLFPSTCEGSAGSVMEAMASGLPVVTSPNAGTVIRHGVEGFVHQYDDVDSLAASVETLASDAARRAEMSRAARARAEHFDLANYGAGLVEAFRAAADVPASAPREATTAPSPVAE
jgi:hypothetical protein